VLLLVLKGKLTVTKFSSWCNVFYANVLGLEENLLCNVDVINSIATPTKSATQMNCNL
jgi:hypothetical protein